MDKHNEGEPVPELIGCALYVRDSMSGLAIDFTIYVHPGYRRMNVGTELLDMTVSSLLFDSSRPWRYLIADMEFPWDSQPQFLEKNGFVLAECPPAYKGKMAVREL